MHVTVTREELDQTNQLLELLRQWEPIRGAGNHYDGGQIYVTMTGNTKASVSTYIDQGQGPRHPKTPVELCNAGIAAAARNAVELLAKDVCAIIRKHMPIPLDQ